MAWASRYVRCAILTLLVPMPSACTSLSGVVTIPAVDGDDSTREPKPFLGHSPVSVAANPGPGKTVGQLQEDIETCEGMTNGITVNFETFYPYEIPLVNCLRSKGQIAEGPNSPLQGSQQQTVQELTPDVVPAAPSPVLPPYVPPVAISPVEPSHPKVRPPPPPPPQSKLAKMPGWWKEKGEESVGEAFTTCLAEGMLEEDLGLAGFLWCSWRHSLLTLGYFASAKALFEYGCNHRSVIQNKYVPQWLTNDFLYYCEN